MDDDIKDMSMDQLEAEVVSLRNGIRQHRDATGHNLCWHVPELWSLLPEKVEPKPEVPHPSEFIQNCCMYRNTLEERKYEIVLNPVRPQKGEPFSISFKRKDGQQPKSHRKFARISTDELLKKIQAVAKDEDNPNASAFDAVELHDHVIKDMKIQFDLENAFWEEYDSASREIVGLHTLENGLTIQGIVAGGDWEQPVFWLVYFDGQRLRGYIPTSGNPWCRKSKQAFGNHDNQAKEVAELIELGIFPKDVHPESDTTGVIDFDWPAIKQDILDRFAEKSPEPARVDK